MASSSIPSGFDAEMLSRVTRGRDDLALELVALLRDDLPRARRDIIAAHAGGQIDTFVDLAHKLAGGTAYCGAVQLKNEYVTLENSPAANGRNADTLLQALENEVGQLLEQVPVDVHGIQGLTRTLETEPLKRVSAP